MSPDGLLRGDCGEVVEPPFEAEAAKSPGKLGRTGRELACDSRNESGCAASCRDVPWDGVLDPDRYSAVGAGGCGVV